MNAPIEKISVQRTSTVPIHLMEDEIIRLNQKGFTIVSSEIVDDKIKLVAVNNFMKVK